MFFAARKSLILAVGVALFGAGTVGCRQEQPATTADRSAAVRIEGQAATNAFPSNAGDNNRRAAAEISAHTAVDRATADVLSLPTDPAESSSVAKSSSRAAVGPMVDQADPSLHAPADALSHTGGDGTAERRSAIDANPAPDGSEPRILPAAGASPIISSATTPDEADGSIRFSNPTADPSSGDLNPLRRPDRETDRPVNETTDWSADFRSARPSGNIPSHASSGPSGPSGNLPHSPRVPPGVPGNDIPADRAAGELRRPAHTEWHDPAGLDQPASDRRPSLRPAAGVPSTASRLVVGDPPADRQAGDGSAAAEKPDARSDKPTPPKRKGKHSGEHFDPIKENGPIFEGWPKPKLALVITGREEGYIEPCGCAGLDRMKGGMARRQTLFRTLRNQGWEVVGLDVGGLARGFGKQAELKFQTMVEAKRRSGYDAVALGTTDLRLPAGELAAVAASADGSPSMFVATNVGLFGFDAGVVPRSKIIDRPGERLGVLAVVGKQTQQAIHNDEIEMVDAETAIRQILPDLKKKAGYLVLLAHMPTEEAEALARKFPEINLVATSGGPAEPPAKLSFVEGAKTIRVEVGEKGMNAVVIGFFDDPRTPVRYQRVPLDSRFESSPEMKALLTAYQDQLRTLGWAGLNIRALPHPQTETNGKFIGSKKCESCHEESTKVWKRTGHSRAFATLENLDPPRHHDPECVSCHVIGWHPTKYFPYQTGYISKEKTPELIDVGCESCHGPGEKHAAAEAGADLELQKRLRQAMVITKEESAKRQCYTCHDLDNSPDFEFESYWPVVEHYED